jgi:hypothetical protein
MKSERRHELKTNTLAEALAKAPHRGRQWITTGTFALVAAVVVGLLVRYRINTAADRLARATDNLAVAREEIEEIKQMALQPVDPSQPEELFKDVSSRLDLVVQDAGDGNPKLTAEALVARGDLNWNMATYSASLAASTTQPVSGIQSPDEFLKSAQAAYNQVISGFPQQDFSVSTARFGLAAAAENSRDWDSARKQYQAVNDDANAPDLLKKLAQAMMGQLDQLQQTPVIGPPMPAAAATQPATTMPG